MSDSDLLAYGSMYYDLLLGGENRKSSFMRYGVRVGITIYVVPVEHTSTRPERPESNGRRSSAIRACRNRYRYRLAVRSAWLGFVFLRRILNSRCSVSGYVSVDFVSLTIGKIPVKDTMLLFAIGRFAKYFSCQPETSLQYLLW